jgi:hypothetical protein
VPTLDWTTPAAIGLLDPERANLDAKALRFFFAIGSAPGVSVIGNAASVSVIGNATSVPVNGAC